MSGFLKLECAAIDFHHSFKGLLANIGAAGCIDNSAFIEFHLAFVLLTAESQHTVQARVFDNLHCIEHTDRAEISRESEMFASEVCLGSRCGLEVRAARAANSFQTTGDVYPLVELLGFEQAIVGGIEIFSLDVETCE